MNSQLPTSCTAFEGFKRIASGELTEVALQAKNILDRKDHPSILIFDDATGEQIEVDFRGTTEDVLQWLKKTISAGDPANAPPRGPGRPKLGVVGREVTLLPRHWDWLNSQPGGASVALRKLVEEARRANAGKDRVRQSREAAYKFMAALAGNLPGFEEATRALFAGNGERFDEQIASWPADVRDHAKKLAAAAFQGTVGDPASSSMSVNNS